MDVKAKVRDHWDNNPMDYDRISAKPLSREYFEQLNAQFRDVCYFGQKGNEKMFARMIPYKEWKGKKVLVVGCGMGTLTTEMALAGAHVTAIDLTANAVRSTKRQLKIRGATANVLQGDAENIPFDDNSFDVVWSWGVIHHTPDTQKCVSEINRVLKPGGRARVMIYHKNSIFNILQVQFYRGILQRRYFGESAQDLLNCYTDHSDKGGTPLAKAYSRSETKKMFSRFRNIRLSTFGVRDEVFAVPFFRRWLSKLPDGVASFFLTELGLGWYLVIDARKV